MNSSSETTGLRAEHCDLLRASAITDEVISASGIKSYSGGISFPWTDGTSPVVWQQRPDKPALDDDGRPMKYLFPKGAKVPFSRLRDGDTYEQVLLVEGTKQQYAALSHAPANFAVYGMFGCWGFSHADLSVFFGREVFLLLDADVETNPKVWAAADALTKALVKNGAKRVLYVTTTGTGTQGLDDVLAGFPEMRRAVMLKTWLSQAAPKLPKRPKGKKPVDGEATEGPERFFRERSKPLHLQPATVAEEIVKNTPAAITPEGSIALYRDGAYRVDQHAILSEVVKIFGDFFTPSIETTVTKFLQGLLYGRGALLPERATAPLLNCTNTMVDLRDGSIVPHSPAHMSSVQVTVEYDPDATAPLYESWLRDALRQDGHSEADLDRLVDDIEETASTMLDPTRTPSKALFLFGPSRSGKSTFLRILKAIAGAANTSAVTLHDLDRDQFAAANLYGRMLNVAADLSSRHVEDLSLFKMLTGEDVIKANRKYGNQFEFTNQALMAFSANELPTVSEASRAYAERMKPYHFPNSFAGREDKTLEARLMAELPGILARWVRAYRRYLTRGGYAPTDAATRLLFEAKSDRVVQFFQDMCELFPAEHGDRMGDDQCTGRREVATAFNAWAERNGGSKMGERAIFQRLASIEGVVDVKQGAKQRRAFNLTVRAADDDTWADEAEPVEEPLESSFEWAAAVPRVGVPAPTSAPVVAAPDPVDPEPVIEPQAAVQAFADPFAEGLDLGYEF